MDVSRQAFWGGSSTKQGKNLNENTKMERPLHSLYYLMTTLLSNIGCSTKYASETFLVLTIKYRYVITS